MRAEKRKKYLIMIMALVLVLAVPLTYLRVMGASKYINFGEKGAILDRFGGVLYDGTCFAPDLIGNLTGGNNMISNSLSVRYSQEMTPTGFHPLAGLKSIEGKVGDNLTTTLLPIADQQILADLFGEYNGCCFAYNYITGEVYTMLSLPSSIEAQATNGAYTNRCLSSRYIPGSTMKIVAALCALSQDPGFTKFTYTCTGVEVLPDGNSVTCGGAHGKVTFTSAIGRSCNCYMAAIIQQFQVVQTQSILEQLGIRQQGSNQSAGFDKLIRVTSRTQFGSNQQFNDVWSLIGQGYSEMSVVDMAMIAGAVANGGKAAAPFVVASIGNDESTSYSASTGIMKNLIDVEIADLFSNIWQDAVKQYYRSGNNTVVPEITCAKTGTAQQGDGTTNRMLLGYMEEKHVAFMIVVEGLPSGNPLAVTIANQLAQLI